jgi:hypothetical protein
MESGDLIPAGFVPVQGLSGNGNDSRKRILDAMVELACQDFLQTFGLLSGRDVLGHLGSADRISSAVIDRRNTELNVD